MCGICGVVQPGQVEAVDRIIRVMTSTIAHRGPDDEGRWVGRDGEHVVAMGNRRLSILDLSPLGHMPMHDSQAGVMMTYNGEIYNFREVKNELQTEGHTFISSGDSEVLLAAYRQWGIGSFERLNGMFAVAFYDPRRHAVLLARDRIGKKPLYYYADRNLFLFGSELKVLMAHPEFPRELDRRALSIYMTLGRIPAPFAIFRHTRKVPPGSYVVYDIHAGTTQVESYWTPGLAADEVPDEDVLPALTDRLESSVQLRLRSDVPVGCVMSSGVDSALVAALSNRYQPGIQTFTVGFGDQTDERSRAAEIATILGTSHRELLVQREDVIPVLARLPEITDEPIAFPAVVPTYLIFRKIREFGIKVVLVGDGGDELFWGYEPGTYAHFLTTLRLRPLWPLLAGPPGRLGKRLAEVDAIARLLPLGWLNVLRRTQFVFDAHTIAQQYFSMIRFTSQADLERMLGGVPLPDPAELLQISRFEEAFVRHPLESVTLFDIVFNLSDFNLDRVDRTSMANSVEARAPLLDYRLVELALSIPVSRKRVGGRPKALLKQVLSRYLPRHLWDRRKQGFDTPASAWLREHLREQAYDLLRSADGMFDREFLQRRFRRHLDAGIDELNVTWPVFVFLQWWNHWVKTSGAVAAHR